MILFTASENHVAPLDGHPRDEGPEIVAVDRYRIDSPRNLYGMIQMKRAMGV